MATIRRQTGVACSDRKISVRAKNLFPRYMREENSELIPLVEAYYRWMEKQEGIQREIYCLSSNNTSQNQDDKFLRVLAEEFLTCFPDSISVDLDYLIQNVRELYSLKGTESGIKLLFKILFGTEPEITYPRESILRASDGVWVNYQVIKTDLIGQEQADFQGKIITGIESGARAIVEVQSTQQENSRPVTTMQLSGVVGLFYQDELIKTTESDHYARVNGVVSSYQITNSGSGYQVGQIIPSTGGDGQGFSARISNVDFDGQITEIEFVNAGVDYSTPPTLDLSGIGDGSATILLYVGQQHEGTGRFLNERGMPSSSMKLQDGIVLQEYSYVIRTDVPRSQYINPLMCISHPAGFNVSGLYKPQDQGAQEYPVLFHLSAPNDLINGSINYKNSLDRPQHPSSSKFIQHKILVNSKLADVEDYIQLYGLDGEGSLSDFSQDIGDYLDRELGDYWETEISRAYLPGLDIFRLHDLYSDYKLKMSSYRSRFYMGSSLEDLFLESPIYWHFDEEVGEWLVLTHREKHVWADHRITSIASGMELLGGGSLDLIGGGQLELIGE